MKPTIIFFLLLSFGLSAQVDYFKDQYCQKPTSEKKAKFVRNTMVRGDGTVVIEVRRKSDVQLFSTTSMKDGAPVGIWRTYNAKGEVTYEADYSFVLLYIPRMVTQVIYYDFPTGQLINGKAESFQPPALNGSTDNIYLQIYKNIRYPAKARQDGIQGTVKLQVRIDTEGQLHLVSLFEEIDLYLAKEAARALRSLPKLEPALMDGEVVEVYTIIPVKFKLE